MYYVIDVQDVIRIPPSKFKFDLKETIKDVVSEERVGTLDSDVGVVLGIIDIKDVGDASVVLGDGAAYVDTTYSTLVFKPELQNIYEGEVKDIAEFGAFIGLGPFDGLVHVSQIMDDFINFDAKNMSFIGRDTKNTLGKGDLVCSRLVSVSLKENVAVSKLGLTMRQAGLGKEDWTAKEKKEKPVKTVKEPKEEKPKKK